MSVYGKAASAILGGISDAEKTTRTRQQEKERRELAQFQHAQMLAALTEQGYGIGEAPAEAPTFDGGLPDAQGKVAPITRTPSRYEQITPGKQGIYRDTTRTPEARRAKAEAEVARRQEERDRRTEERAIRLEQVRQQGRAPTAPVMGSPEWKAAEDYKASLSAKYRKPEQGDGAPKKPHSEWNQKADFMLDGVESSVPEIDALDAKGVTFPKRSRFAALNRTLSDEEQQMLRAAMTMHDAYLRLTTGATINDSELEQAAMQYIPLDGDKEGNRAAKARRRQEVIRAIRKAAGRDAATPAPAGNVDLRTPASSGRKVQARTGRSFTVPE